jgi:hypothetical protein
MIINKQPSSQEDAEGEGGDSSQDEGTKNSKALALKKKKKPVKPQYLLFCTSKCRYSVIKKAVKLLGYKLTDDESADWDIYWNDTQGVLPDQFAKL